MMLEWLTARLEALRDRRRRAREIRPQAFRMLAAELQELAGLALRLTPRHHKFYNKIKRIQREMDHLNTLVSKPEFKRLSPQKRRELRESLIQSREQLIETVKTAPAPTSTLQ